MCKIQKRASQGVAGAQRQHVSYPLQVSFHLLSVTYCARWRQLSPSAPLTFQCGGRQGTEMSENIS